MRAAETDLNKPIKSMNLSGPAIWSLADEDGRGATLDTKPVVLRIWRGPAWGTMSNNGSCMRELNAIGA